VADILFQHEVKEHLGASGLGVDGFMISVNGTPYFAVGDDIFIATEVCGGSSGDFANGPGFLDIIARVAHMHHILAGAKITGGAIGAKFGQNTGRHMESLGQLKRKLLKAGKFSEFDMHFLRGYEEFGPHIEAYGHINKDPLTNEGYVCHNLLKEENIYINSGEIILTNFSEAARAHYLFDLSYIVKRHIKAAGVDAVPLVDILDIYCKNHPNCGFDEEIFRRILLYPDKFIKVAIDYYSKKRSFAPKTYLSRIEECFRTKDALLKYI